MSVAQDHSSTSSSPAVPSLAQSPPKKFNRSCSVSEEILSHDEASVPVSVGEIGAFFQKFQLQKCSEV